VQNVTVNGVIKRRDSDLQFCITYLHNDQEKCSQETVQRLVWWNIELICSMRTTIKNHSLLMEYRVYRQYENCIMNDYLLMEYKTAG